MKTINKKNNKSQITIFVILAIAIVAVLLIIFYPNIKKFILPSTPGDLIPKECMETTVKENLKTLMLRGGNMKPELYFIYYNETLDYLCYTGEWYKTCVMQKPFLKQEIEKQLNEYSAKKIESCINSMTDKLKSKGYEVKVSGTRKAVIEIVPKKIIIRLDIDMILTKNEQSQSLNDLNFLTSFSSNSYDMIMITSSIQNFEARYGDSTPEDYMFLYPNLKVQKLKQGDGTKVYIIEDRNTKEKLQFATRSLVWPPGWGFNPSFA